MKYIRIKPIQRFFCIILALLVFNISIDPPDMLRNLDSDFELEEDLSVNEIESISELVLEQGLEIENAVPETEDPDTDNFIKKVEVITPLTKCFTSCITIYLPDNSTIFFYIPSDYKPFWSEILNPPPEA